MSLPFSLESPSLTRSLGWRLPIEAAASFLGVCSSAAGSPFPHLLEGPFHKRDQRRKVHRLTEDIERPQAQGLKPQLIVCRDGAQDHQRFRSKGPKLLE